MSENKKRNIILVIATIIAAILAGLGFYNINKDADTNEIIDSVVNEIINEIIITRDTQKLVNETIEATKNEEDLSTTEIIESTEEEEKNLEEENLEIDAQVEQENISYNGDNNGNGLSLLGAYQGLTYYNQADSRWANVMYSITGDSSQTIKSSGCGPTAAAIVVSSSKGAILPTTMAQLFVDNGYRTTNNGTAWAAFSFVADYFDFDEYYTTSNFNTAMNYLKTDADNDGNSDYYIVVSCGSGLFTSGGHYIVFVAENNGTITVYDPYLYSGKFNTASRRGANVIVSGNSAYVTEEAFEEYANYRNFWIFSNDNGSGTITSNNSTSVNYTRYVATKTSNLNVRNGAGMNYNVINSLAKGTAVTVAETIGNWSRITSPVSGWVSNSYLSSSSVNSTNYITGSYTVTASLLHVRTGPSTNYAIKTYRNLTSNARSQNKSKGNYYANGLLRDVNVTVSQVSGNWGKIPSGWICLDYCRKR